MLAMPLGGGYVSVFASDGACLTVTSTSVTSRIGVTSAERIVTTTKDLGLEHAPRPTSVTAARRPRQAVASERTHVSELGAGGFRLPRSQGQRGDDDPRDDDDPDGAPE